MTTRAELRESLRPLLRDKTIWPDSALDEWVRQAIAEYSLHFPRITAGSFSCTAGTHAYDLFAVTGLHLGVRRVEYPSGQNPPVFLKRKSETDADFYAGGGWYDLRYEGSTEMLVLGPGPAAGETVTVTYLLAHTYPGSEAGLLTIPDVYLGLVRLFVNWKALLALELEEVGGIERKPTVLKELGVTARFLEQAYFNELAR